ncbi:hypothetical protein Clacol_007672 [Clathrus columnatus]|uniref:Uncharacterized protein n=1 Tax=Clathrus columnatus TaxID=1419009 RepID=A0AAV5AJY5_9AGAM|nr:hypothetical protein Clacol_007672 [Clathrus columnatus]
MGLRLLKKPGTEYPTNPMKNVVPFKTFLRLALIAFLPSVAIAIVITYFPSVL